MKKLLTACLTLMLMFSMTACSKEKISDEALEAYITSSENITKITSATYSTDMEVDVSDDSMAIRIYGEYDTHEDLEASMKVDMESNGLEMEEFMSLYLKDSYLYMNMMDLSKEKTDISSFKGMISDMLLLETIADDKEKAKAQLKEYLEEADLDGDTLTLVFKKESLTKMLQEKIQESSSISASERELIESQGINKLTISETLKDGIAVETEINMELNILVNAKLETVNLTINNEFSNINQNIPVNFPSDLDSYIESSSFAQNTI